MRALVALVLAACISPARAAPGPDAGAPDAGPQVPCYPVPLHVRQVVTDAGTNTFLAPEACAPGYSLWARPQTLADPPVYVLTALCCPR